MNGADLVEDVEADDDVELLNDNGLPRGRRPRMVEADAETVAMSRKERDSFIDHIARLRTRLEKHEPDGDLAGDHARLTADQTIALESRLASTQAELRVAEDSIREHIRQKARLRDQVDKLSKGAGEGVTAELRTRLLEMPDRVSRLIRAVVDGVLAEVTDARRGRTGGPDASVAPTDAPAADVDDPPATAPSRVAPAAALVDESRASVSADARIGDVAPASAASPAPTDAPVNGKSRPRPPGGWFTVTLQRMGGEHTAREVAAADNRNPTAGNQAAAKAVEHGRVEACGTRGRSPIYRIKA